MPPHPDGYAITRQQCERMLRPDATSWWISSISLRLGDLLIAERRKRAKR